MTRSRGASAQNLPARWIRAALAILLLGGTLAVAAHYWLGLGGETLQFPLEVLYDAVVLGAGVACLVRASAYRRERTAWTLIGIAILFWGAAEVYWTAFIEDNPSAPYPSPADIGYLVFYPLAYAGIAMLVRARAHELNWRLWMDGAIAALGTAALGAAFVFDFVAEKTEGTSIEVATTLAYPLGDIAMLAILVGVVALTGWRPGLTWSLLLAGLAAMAVADIAFTLQITEEALPGGSWVEPVYLLSAVCLGAAVWQPAEATQLTSPAEWEGRREIIVPAVFAGVMIGLFAIQYVSATSGLSTFLWIATMTAVIVRLAISDRENRRLLEQVQSDPLTGLANRGRMQVDVEAIVSQATAEHPVCLAFLDLNGFKHYNDNFGHPAGDALLVRLGEALRTAIGEEGTAYRVGGDEFCVLLTCEQERFADAIDKAGGALSESGKGFSIDASVGAAIVPDDAPNPSEALRLADVRMYAQKESRRTVEGREGEWPVPAVARPVESGDGAQSRTLRSNLTEPKS